MKTVKYETSPGALAAFVAGRPQAAMLCDLYTITPTGSAWPTLRYCTLDTDVRVPYSPTVLYSSRDILFDQEQNKAHAHWAVGLDVDTWQVLVIPSKTAAIGSLPFLSALRTGALDGAVVEVDRAVFDTSSGLPSGLHVSPLGVVNMFTGRMSEVDIGRSGAILNVNSYLDLLNVLMPQNLYQAGCRWTLFSAGCTLAAATFAVNGTISSGAASGANPISATLATPTGSRTYSLGRITMTSGLNNGFSRSIRSWTPGSPASLKLMAPFYYPLSVGDTFTAYPGCDKKIGTCKSFGNLPNFGGQPYIPVQETAL